MFKGKKEILIVFLFIFLLGSIWLALDFYQMQKLKLPEKVKTISQFVEKMPKPKYIFTFDRDDKPFIVFVGDMPTFPSLPSGNPIYIFDKNGQVVYWVIDSGETESDWIKLISNSNQRKISVDEAFQIVSDKNP